MNRKNKKRFIEILGWYGMLAIILAYLLVSFGVVEANSYTFQLLNLTGAIGVIFVSAVKGVTQSVVLNIFWAIIAIIALVNIFLN